MSAEDGTTVQTTTDPFLAVLRLAPGPDQQDVDALRGLLDLMQNFTDNDQRARFLLSSNWMRDRGAAAAQRNAVSLALTCAATAVNDVRHARDGKEMPGSVLEHRPGHA